MMLQRPSTKLILVVLCGFCLQLGHARWFRRMGIFSNIVDGLGFGSEEEEEAAAPGGIDRGLPYFFEEERLNGARAILEFRDTPMYIVVLAEYRDKAIYEDGRLTNLTGFDADKLFSREVMSDMLPAVGGEVVYGAEVEKTDYPLTDSTSNKWDSIAVLYVPNGKAFARLVANPRFLPLSEHAKAGLEDVLVYACAMIPGSSMESLQSVPNTPVSKNMDLPVSTVEFLDFERVARYQRTDSYASRVRRGRAAVQIYDDVARMAAMNRGMRVAAEFEVAVTLVPSRADDDYQEFRIYTYQEHASLTAFETIDAKTGRVSDVRHHFNAGLGAAISLQVSPMFINSLGGNAQIGQMEACAKASSSHREQKEPGAFDPVEYCP